MMLCNDEMLVSNRSATCTLLSLVARTHKKAARHLSVGMLGLPGGLLDENESCVDNC